MSPPPPPPPPPSSTPRCRRPLSGRAEGRRRARYFFPRPLPQPTCRVGAAGALVFDAPDTIFSFVLPRAVVENVFSVPLPAAHSARLVAVVHEMLRQRGRVYDQRRVVQRAGRHARRRRGHARRVPAFGGGRQRVYRGRAARRAAGHRSLGAVRRAQLASVRTISRGRLRGVLPHGQNCVECGLPLGMRWRH